MKWKMCSGRAITINGISRALQLQSNNGYILVGAVRGTKYYDCYVVLAAVLNSSNLRMREPTAVCEHGEVSSEPWGDVFRYRVVVMA